METADSEISSFNRKAIILHVDDEPIQQEFYRLIIERKLPAVHVISATDPIEAFAILEDIKPDLIITDTIMPNMGGLDFIRRLKANPEWRSIPVAVGSPAEVHRDKAYELGVVDFLTHPFMPERLIEMIKHVLQI